jgi:hypothetical protein
MAASVRNSIDPDKLHLYHDNPNTGDVPLIKESLLENDQLRPVVVNVGTLTGRPNEVLAGNHTVMAVRELREEYPNDPRWQRVLYHSVDVDDVRAAKIVLADNRTGEKGRRDDEAVLRLLEALGDDDLVGTGYDNSDLADLLALSQESSFDLITDRKPSGPKEDDGLVDNGDLVEQRDRYADQSTRLIILTLPIPQFVWAQEQLAAIRDEQGFDANTEAVIWLLESWSGGTAPAADAEDTPAENPFSTP